MNADLDTLLQPYTMEQDELPRHSRPHRCAVSCGWRHAREASIAAFFLFASLLVLIAITHLMGWHL